MPVSRAVRVPPSGAIPPPNFHTDACVVRGLIPAPQTSGAICRAGSPLAPFTARRRYNRPPPLPQTRTRAEPHAAKQEARMVCRNDMGSELENCSSRSGPATKSGRTRQVS